MGGKGDDLNKKWARCRLDAAMKGVGGLLLGTLGSVLLARARPWPIVLGTGIGLGLAYINCEQDMNEMLNKE